MKRYIRVYRALLRLNFLALITYRANFVNGFIASVGWGLFSIVSIWLLTSKTRVVNGWTREELLILAGAYNVIVGFFHFFFLGNFHRFAHIIHRGELDTYLVKPIDSQFLLSFWLVRLTNFFRIFLSLLFTLYLFSIIHIPITIINIISFCILLVFSVLLLYSIFYIFITFTLWFTSLSNIVDLLMDLTTTARYPQEFLLEIKSFFILFLLPFTLIVATPTKVLLSRALSGELIELFILSLLFFYLSRRFWHFALRHYTSASS